MNPKQIATVLINLVKKLNNLTWKSEITNLPETQKVEVVNPTEAQETVEVSNLIDVRPELKDIVNAIEEKVQKFDDTAQKKDILKAIKELKTTPAKDLTPDVIKGIDKSVKLLEKLLKVKPDFSEIVKALDKEEKDPLEKYARLDEIKTRFNEKQLKELVDAFKSISVVAGATGGAIKNNSGVITHDNPLPVDMVDNFNIPAYDFVALTYIASGNGEGEIETAIYKDGGSGGTTVATLTIAYNSDDEISSITKT